MTGTGFHHEALLYSGEREFLAGTVPFLESAVEAGEPAMVVLSLKKHGLLRRALGRNASGVQFVDMLRVGTNPSAIIGVWREWVDEVAAGGGRVWGVGEPVWAERSPAELDECFRHECLLNLAFAGADGFRLLCPYDTGALAPDVVDRAFVSHPVVLQDGVERASRSYRHPHGFGELLEEPLPPPVGKTRELAFQTHDLSALRRFVLEEAQGAGLDDDAAEQAVLALSELATNTARHGGGQGRLRAWSDGDRLVCEVHDGGRISDPLAGRLRPVVEDPGGYGLWMVNQLCDLVQVRSSATGTVVRVHKQRKNLA